MKSAPDYAFISRHINARDDSLVEGSSSLWNALKGRHRCVVPVMGYYEWLKKSSKERIPYFTKRADGKVMFLAGLWDSVQYEGTCRQTGADNREFGEVVYLYSYHYECGQEYLIST
jgi:putative SOS response-associated peptidase YedK